MEAAYRSKCRLIKSQADLEYEKLMNKYRTLCRQIDTDYSNQISELKTQMEGWRKSETIRISQLKIIIPNSLKEIYGVISSLGK